MYINLIVDQNIDLKLLTNSGEKFIRLIGGSTVSTSKLTLKRPTNL
jgi:hypothetical protein